MSTETWIVCIVGTTVVVWFLLYMDAKFVRSRGDVPGAVKLILSAVAIGFLAILGLMLRQNR